MATPSNLLAAQQQRRLVEQQRQAQVAVRSGFLAEFLAAWGLLNVAELDATLPGWLRVVLRLIRVFRQESAALALDHYRELRRISAPADAPPMPEVDFDLGDLLMSEQRISRVTRTRRSPAAAPDPLRFDREPVALRRAGAQPGLTIRWDRADQAAEVALRVTGPINIKARVGRGESPERAARAALVEASGAASRQVLNGGRNTQLALVHSDRAALGWVRVTDSDPCAFCAMLSSRGLTWGPYAKESFAKSNEKFSGKVFEAQSGNDDPRLVGRGQAKVHDHCVVPGTLVTGPSVEVAYRRPYQGELIIVGLADGGELSITPNHPVLTDRGWIEAGLLREGDNVVGRSGADLTALDVPHEYDVPTPIEDVWGSRRMSPVATMPVSAEDFHGDGGIIESKVDIVAPYRQFSDELDSEHGERFAQEFVTRSGLPSVVTELTPQGNTLADLFALLGSAQSVMSGLNVGSTLLGTERRLMQGVGLGLTSTLGARLLQPALHDRARHSVALAEYAFWSAEQVCLDELLVRRFDPASHLNWPRAGRSGSDQSSFEQGDAERVRTHAELGRALIERLAGGVKLRRVRELRRVKHAGDVLNLQTVEGWYDANGVIVSNCACVLVPVFSRSDPLLDQGKAYRELWDAHIRNRYSGEAALRAWRRLHEQPEVFARKAAESAARRHAA